MPKLPKITNLHNLCDISERSGEWSWIFVQMNIKFSINWCYRFWWAWPDIPRAVKVTSVQYFCNISIKNWGMKLIFSMLINMKVFQKLILLFLKDLEFVLSLWHLKKQVRNEVRDLTALASSNTTLTMYYTSNVLPPLNLFLSQLGIFLGIISLFFIWLIVCVT